MAKMEASSNIKMWHGAELEGKDKGKYTLFVKDEYNIHKIKVVLNKYKIKRIYFGAGNQSRIRDYSVVQYFLKQKYDVVIETLEINKQIKELIILYTNLKVVLTIKNDDIRFLRCYDYIKIESKEQVFMDNIGKMEMNYLGEGYENDKEA